MTDTTWTWLLFAMETIGIAGMIAIGRHHWWGWAIVLTHSIPWAIYSLTHNKPGFLAMTLLWWTTHLWNTTRWYKQHKNRQTPHHPRPTP